MILAARPVRCAPAPRWRRRAYRWNTPWVKFPFAAVYAAAAGTWWVRVSRSGANDSSNYYLWKTDESQAYAGGKYRKYNGAVWTDRNPGGDGLFRVFGSMATTAQISAAAANAIGGQFLAGVRIKSASGVATNPFRDGNRTAKEEIEDLLMVGNSAGVRMLGEVTQDRYLRVYPQPAAADAELLIHKSGHLCDRHGITIPAWRKAAGEWARVAALQGVGSPAARIKDAVFLESVAWDGVGLRIGVI